MPGEAETKQPSSGRWRNIGEISAAGGGTTPADETPLDRALRAGASHDGRRDGEKKPSYYDIPILQPPVWTPEIGHYFFLGGLSAGAFVLSRLAGRFGRGRYQQLRRTGTYVAAAAILPAAPLLIWDLGDPKRFHHMLRVWKPTSPMNLGSWTLTGYMATGALSLGREVVAQIRHDRELTGTAKAVDEAVGAVSDAAGIPLALVLAGYTGVLLSTTATPAWCRNPYLGALFSASAISAGAAAVHLAVDATGQEGDAPLKKVETAAHLAEAAMTAGYVLTQGEMARPLTRGAQAAQFWAGAVGAGLVLPTILNGLPLPKKAKRWAEIGASVLSLVGGFFLRHAFVAAGKPSAVDPDLSRMVGSAGEDGRNILS